MVWIAAIVLLAGALLHHYRPDLCGEEINGIEIDFSGIDVYVNLDTGRGFVSRNNSNRSSLIIGRPGSGVFEVINEDDGGKTFSYVALSSLVGNPDDPIAPVVSEIVPVKSKKEASE